MLGSVGPQLTLDPNYGPSAGGFTSAFIGNTYLEEIHLTGHVMTASTSRWPTALATLPNLRVLHISGPAAPGSQLPSAWSSMTQLQSLWLLNMTYIQGEGRASLTMHRSLIAREGLVACKCWIIRHAV
jgi:hypothetical protein